MQIMSPNGHHVTFTDPPVGASFISNAISPGMGFYATVLPGLTTLNGMGEKYKDLAGGIHIGDRYGLYEIQMTSHKRSIDINYHEENYYAGDCEMSESQSIDYTPDDIEAGDTIETVWYLE